MVTRARRASLLLHARQKYPRNLHDTSTEYNSAHKPHHNNSNKMKPITKAVFPVAGMGTRFLPATKASPKEMMPIVDKPLIQFAVEEAVAAGMTDLIFITGRNKRAIEDHFDKAYELETELERRGKQDLLDSVRSILPKHVNCIYIRQTEALGLGHAVLCAKPAIADEPFAVLLADDLIIAEHAVTLQMVEIHKRYNSAVLGVQEVPRSDTGSYGIVATRPLADRLETIDAIIEKPKPENAPSTLAVVGRYILPPRIFHHLEQVRPGAGGEIQLTDAIATLMTEQQVLAYRYQGTRYDCGSKLGYLQATLEIGQAHAEVGDDFRKYLESFGYSRSQ